MSDQHSLSTSDLSSLIKEIGPAAELQKSPLKPPLPPSAVSKSESKKETF